MISMISAVSRCARTPGWQLAAANSIWIQSFTAKAPRFNEKPLVQSDEQSDEQSNGQANEQSNGQANGQANEQSTAPMRRSIVRRTILPVSPINRTGRTMSSNVIACISEEEMDEILFGRTRYLYRKFFFDESTRYVWLYVRRPVGKLSYVAEIGGCRLVPSELDLLPYYKNKRREALCEADKSRMIERKAGEGSADGGIGALPNITYHSENPRRFNIPGLPRYAFLIRHLWEIVWPTHGITCEELWERGFLQSPPPPKYITARDRMVSYLPLARQRVLF